MQLGFLHFEVSDIPAWTTFLTAVLGLVQTDTGRFRMDGHAYRIVLTEGPADDLAALGWEVDDATFDAVHARLIQNSVACTLADGSERLARRRLTFLDPAGIPIEVVTELTLAEAPFQSPVVPGGFVADALGLGHVVLGTRSKQESVDFYTHIFGIRLSDHIQCEIHGYPVDISFFHVNPRHHSVAFGGPQRKRLHHFMLEVQGVDEVGRAYDRTIRSGARIIQTLGRHPNDRMLRFYARTPSQFEFELGWGGRQIDDDTWTPTTYDHISEWGHHPPQLAFARTR